MSYFISRTVDFPFDRAIERTVEELNSVVGNEALAGTGALVREKLSRVIDGI